MINDVRKERNRNSNPSLFIKFLAINNLKILPDKDLEDIVHLCIDKINQYISCDKNLLNLMFLILKNCNEKLKKKTKQELFENLI